MPEPSSTTTLTAMTPATNHPIHDTLVTLASRGAARGGKRQDVAEMRLFDGAGELVAHATATFTVLPNVPLAATAPPTLGA